jgi:hypothetical protein
MRTTELPRAEQAAKAAVKRLQKMRAALIIQGRKQVRTMAKRIGCKTSDLIDGRALAGPAKRRRKKKNGR